MSPSKYAVEDKESTVESNCYLWKEGALKRKWRSPVIPSSDEWKVLYQIVLPWKYHHDVLSLAHDTPMVGHLGIKKT